MIDLFSEASEDDITIEYTNLPLNKSMSTPDEHGDFILMDYSLINSRAKERECLGHELGHCKTGSFYNAYSPFDIRKKHEIKADRWAIKELLPFDKMRGAMRAGYTEVWQLAEYFDITEDFIHKALDYYINARGLDFNSPL